MDPIASLGVVGLTRRLVDIDSTTGREGECGRVLALMRGRYHLSTEDVERVARAVLRHRIILNFDAHADGQTPESVLNAIIKGVAAHATA